MAAVSTEGGGCIVAESIRSWYEHRESQAVCGQLDDEALEPVLPWDRLERRPHTERAAESAIRPRPSRPAAKASSVRKETGAPQKTASGAKIRKRAVASRPPLVIPDDLRIRILAAARVQPHLRIKRLARSMQAAGITVTTAQIAAVLAPPVVRRAPKPDPQISVAPAAPTRPPKALIPPVIRATRHTDPVVDGSYCNGCGVRLDASGICRCS